MAPGGAMVAEQHGQGGESSTSSGEGTLRLLVERASCRAFRRRRVEPEVLRRILEAGVHAATGGNLQPYSIVKIEDPAVLRELGAMCRQPFIGRAPVGLLFCIDWRRLRRWARISHAPFTAHHAFRHFWISFQDTIICAQNICTAADALGLGSVYIGTIFEFLPRLREMFDLPRLVLPVVLLVLGYPTKRPPPREKLPPEVVVHEERYRDLPDEKLVAAFEEKYGTSLRPLGERALAELRETATLAHGDEFARECVEAAQAAGGINTAQYYFGLHYRAHRMPKANERFLAEIREYGFRWFEPFEAPIAPEEDEDPRED